MRLRVRWMKLEKPLSFSGPAAADSEADDFLPSFPSTFYLNERTNGTFGLDAARESSWNDDIAYLCITSCSRPSWLSATTYLIVRGCRLGAFGSTVPPSHPNVTNAASVAPSQPFRIIRGNMPAIAMRQSDIRFLEVPDRNGFE